MELTTYPAVTEKGEILEITVPKGATIAVRWEMDRYTLQTYVWGEMQRNRGGLGSKVKDQLLRASVDIYVHSNFQMTTEWLNGHTPWLFTYGKRTLENGRMTEEFGFLVEECEVSPQLNLGFIHE